MMQDYILRMQHEREELSEKFSKLNVMLVEPKGVKLTRPEKHLMYEQLHCMEKYIEILDVRIELGILKEQAVARSGNETD